MSDNNHSETTEFIWNIANKLRGPYRPPQYRRVMLPMTVLRRMDCVLEGTKEEVLPHVPDAWVDYSNVEDEILEELKV